MRGILRPLWIRVAPSKGAASVGSRISVRPAVVVEAVVVDVLFFEEAVEAGGALPVLELLGPRPTFDDADLAMPARLQAADDAAQEVDAGRAQQDPVVEAVWAQEVDAGEIGLEQHRRRRGAPRNDLFTQPPARFEGIVRGHDVHRSLALLGHPASMRRDQRRDTELVVHVDVGRRVVGRRVHLARRADEVDENHRPASAPRARWSRAGAPVGWPRAEPGPAPRRRHTRQRGTRRGESWPRASGGAYVSADETGAETAIRPPGR